MLNINLLCTGTLRKVTWIQITPTCENINLVEEMEPEQIMQLNKFSAQNQVLHNVTLQNYPTVILGLI